MVKIVEAVVYGHRCLSQSRLEQRLSAFQSEHPGFHWRLARPDETRRFLRSNTLIIFPVTQVGASLLSGVPEESEILEALGECE